MKIACIQLGVPDGETKHERIERVVSLVDAEAADADLVVLPELWSTGYFAFGRYEQEAEAPDGPVVTALCEAAARNDVHLMGGSFVERRGEDLANCAIMIGPTGEVIHRYRKIHLFGYESEEARLLTPGDEVPTVSTELGTLGTSTCYDLRFPELYRLLVDGGAGIVVVPAAWPHARVEHWRLLVQARAVENQVLLIACNGAGEQSGVRLGGHSMIVGPWGDILAEAGEEQEILRVTVDTDQIAATRAEFPVLEHRRFGVGPAIA